MICDGTTLSTFINNRIDYRGESAFKAEQSFVNAYLFLKDYDMFRGTQYTNPKAEIKCYKVPKCAKDALNEFLLPGNTSFNKCLINGKKSK